MKASKKLIIGGIVLAIGIWGYVIVSTFMTTSGNAKTVAVAPAAQPKTKTPVQPAVTAQVVQPTETPQPEVVRPQVTVPVKKVQPAEPTPEVKQNSPTSTPVSSPAPAKQPATCPAPTANGAYFQRGTDASGQPICGFAYYNACPYSEAVSASDPMCYKGQKQ